MTDIQKEVIDFVADQIGVKRSKITVDTLLMEDLGVNGDDGVELLLAFSEKFDVDLDSFNKTYFGPEGIDLITPLLFPIIFPISLLLDVLGIRKRVTYEISPLPVSVLIASAKAKKWVDD